MEINTLRKHKFIRKVIARTINAQSLSQYIRVYIQYWDRDKPTKEIKFVDRDKFQRFQDWVLSNHIDNDIWLWN